jgi:hypothetical protein
MKIILLIQVYWTKGLDCGTVNVNIMHHKHVDFSLLDKRVLTVAL